MWPFSRNGAGRPRSIDVHEAFQRVRAGARLVDVRSEHEFSTAHPKGARNVPPARIARGETKLDRDDEIMVICLSGHRSPRQAKRLMRMGFTNVANVEGGLRAWQRAGLPVKGRRR